MIYEMKTLEDEGLLWLVNKVVFNPRGYELQFVYDVTSGDVMGWRLVGNGEDEIDTDDDHHGFEQCMSFFEKVRDGYA